LNYGGTEQTITAQTVAQKILSALEGACLSFELLAAALFGSVARGEARFDSDVDLLVIGRGIPLPRHRRSREIVQIKHLLPGQPLDILLMTADEARSNFDNHNPLFLDIAEDGIVLLDGAGMLSDAMRATRRYVRERGIGREEAGWRFPVVRGAPTYLSKVSNLDFAQAMLKDAARDHEIAQRLSESAYYDKAVYHFQQAVEKSVKAILIALGVFRKTHLAGAALRGLCGSDRVPAEWRDRLVQVADYSEELEPDLSLSRYPGIVNDALWFPADEYRVEDARSAASKSAETLQIAGVFVREWFSEIG